MFFFSGRHQTAGRRLQRVALQPDVGADGQHLPHVPVGEAEAPGVRAGQDDRVRVLDQVLPLALLPPRPAQHGPQGSLHRVRPTGRTRWSPALNLVKIYPVFFSFLPRPSFTALPGFFRIVTDWFLKLIDISGIYLLRTCLNIIFSLSNNTFKIVVRYHLIGCVTRICCSFKGSFSFLR